MLRTLTGGRRPRPGAASFTGVLKSTSVSHGAAPPAGDHRSVPRRAGRVWRRGHKCSAIRKRMSGKRQLRGKIAYCPATLAKFEPRKACVTLSASNCLKMLIVLI